MTAGAFPHRYAITGPRFYVSVTKAAAAEFAAAGSAGGAEDGEALLPPMPAGLRAALWPEAGPREVSRIRGLGWALAPPGSDPQDLHADLWGRTAKVPSLYLPCTFPVPSLYLPCTFPAR